MKSSRLHFINRDGRERILSIKPKGNGYVVTDEKSRQQTMMFATPEDARDFCRSAWPNSAGWELKRMLVNE